MILAVSLNPALDVTHHVAGVDWSGVNRVCTTDRSSAKSSAITAPAAAATGVRGSAVIATVGTAPGTTTRS